MCVHVCVRVHVYVCARVHVHTSGAHYTKVTMQTYTVPLSVCIRYSPPGPLFGGGARGREAGSYFSNI